MLCLICEISLHDQTLVSTSDGSKVGQMLELTPKILEPTLDVRYEHYQKPFKVFQSRPESSGVVQSCPESFGIVWSRPESFRIEVGVIQSRSQSHPESE